MIPENHPEDAQSDANYEAEYSDYRNANHDAAWENDDDPRPFHDLERRDDEHREQTDERDPNLDEPPTELLIPGVITAKHWLPANEKDFFAVCDPRGKLHLDIEKVTIEPAVVMDPEKPDPVKIISSWWIHADCHNVMTPDIFYLDLMAGLSELATTIREDQDPFQPVRLYKDANAAYGVGYFDFKGELYPFDLRVVVQFGTWQFRDVDNQPVNSSGFKFSICTLVLPTESDQDIYVGKDWGKMFDDPDCMKRKDS